MVSELHTWELNKIVVWVNRENKVYLSNIYTTAEYNKFKHNVKFYTNEEQKCKTC